MTDFDVLDHIAHIATTGLLGTLTRSDLLSLDPSPEWVHLKGGATLIRQGDHGADYFLLGDGRLRLFVENNGSIVHSRFVYPGEGIGEMSLITGEPRSATVRAEVDSRLIRFSAETFRTLMMRRPEAALEIVRTVVHRLRDAERAHAALSRYFSPNLAQLLACDASTIDLGGRRREIATLFTDIAGFTALVETLEPKVLGPLLNDYLVGMTDIAFAHEGTVAKIVGDALHVLFGAPGEQHDHATRAVACALALDEYAQSSRQRWHHADIPLGLTRIGVHAGPAIVGNFGGGRFFDYTAYGDTINVAARLEAANKQLATRICVSATLAAKAEDFRGRPVGDLMLRGKSEALRAFEPLRVDVYEHPATKSYLEAFAKLEAGDPSAIAGFAAHVGKYPEDRLASFHLKRLLNGATGTLIAMD